MLCFLPVIFAWAKAKYVTSSDRIQLEEESEEGENAHTNKMNSPPLPLDGWKVFLFWIPALCDLTGTTVRAF
jgi:hypothetical protein